MDLKSGVDKADKAYQNHKGGREKIHDEFHRILKVKRTNQGLYSKYEEK
jgi:hypothetical protein